MKQWFSNMQKEIYVLGPLLPPGYGIETQNCEEGESDDIEAFLGEMQVKHGKRSVFFVSYFPSFYISTKKKILRFPLELPSIHPFRNTLMS